MKLSTKNPSIGTAVLKDVGSLTSREKIDILKKKHQPLLDNLGESDSQFIPKMAYKPKQKDELFITFFTTELRRGRKIFTEFVSRTYEPEDEQRTLWLWEFNPHWEEEYEIVDGTEGTSSERYLIPVSELVTIRPETKVKSSEPLTQKQQDAKEFISGLLTNSSILEDAPLSELTIRDFATIMTGKPVSNKEWLNNLFR